MKPIYLDHNATTPVDPSVIDAMVPYLGARFGNASSVHAFGRDAKVALETARESIAAFINCEPAELFFTSGGTESDNIAILGTAEQLKSRRTHLIVGAAEHPAIHEPAEMLARKEKCTLDYLPVNEQGFSSADELRKLVSDKTALVSVMHGNNETGAIQDIASLVEAAHETGCLFHTDAVQSIGKVPIDVKALDVDLLSLTGHKIYGPKGAGAMFIRQSVKIAPLFYGGSHEKKRRPGTENVAGAVGLAKALELAAEKMDDDYARLAKLADQLIDGLMNNVPDCRLNSPRKNRVPQTVNIAFSGIEGESIVLNLDIEGIAASSGSACASGAIEPSHVLVAMNVPKVIAQGAIRFSLGRGTSSDDIERVIQVLPPIVKRLREMSPIYDGQN